MKVEEAVRMLERKKQEAGRGQPTTVPATDKQKGYILALLSMYVFTASVCLRNVCVLRPVKLGALLCVLLSSGKPGAQHYDDLLLYEF
jgi:hypothetical protein